MSSNNLNTLHYWFDVEALTYQELPKENKAKQRHAFFQQYDDLPLWQTAPYTSRQQELKYFVYFGLVSKRVLDQELLKLYAPGPEQEDYAGSQQRNTKGQAYLCSIEITGSGSPVITSLQLAAWAIAFAERKNQKPLSYTVIADTLKMKAATLWADLSHAQESTPPFVDGGWFSRLIDLLVEELDWQPRELLASPGICLHTISLINAKGKPIKNPPELEPINSYYLDDIVRVLNQARQGQEAKQVQRYLASEVTEQHRVDVTQPDVINTLLAPKQFPPGRWPSPFPLFLMQQVAVNTALSDMADGGLFSVNGPPGTGKTTLLMDIIAARIIERAAILATFNDPKNAFTPHETKVEYPASGKNSGGVEGKCYLLDPRLLDHGIVVASANNNAVENITRDLPNRSKVDDSLMQIDGRPFDYFSSLAESILNEAAKPKKPWTSGAIDDQATESGAEEVDLLATTAPETVPCWGLISVALGKKSNRSLVVNALKRIGEQKGLVGSLADLPFETMNWQHAREQFDAACKDVRQIQSDIEQFEQERQKQVILQHQLAEQHAIAASLHESLQRVTHERDSAARLLAEADAQNALVLASRQQLLNEWPEWRQFWKWLSNRTSLAQFRAKQNELNIECDELRKTSADMRRNRLESEKAITQLEQERTLLNQTISSIDTQLQVLAHRCTALTQALGSAAFDPEAFRQQTVEQQQKSLPRSNAAYHQARAKVFVTALHLHQAFMKHADKMFNTNFNLALSMLGQEAFIQKHLPLMAPHFWATFFLAVPVVSSTFASFSRCFNDLGEGQIGLLLIDEAGQAVPSHALGAIWRAKRALVVGDPLQVEPVLTMPVKLDSKILEFHQAQERHQLTQYSAQHLADRVNRHGASVKQFDGNALWVGSPLRVHRRCVDPMFSLANSIAYDNTMVYGPNVQEEIDATSKTPLYGPSHWINQASDDFDEHFSLKEALLALDIVIWYKSQGLVGKADGLPDLFLISPFKSVAEGLRSTLKEKESMWAIGVDSNTVDNWLKTHVGTVHTFQGKECESVIFILGGKTDGAINWAACKPNIINVAATRAKRRLYVIGNRDKWCKTRFGASMFKALEVE